VTPCATIGIDMVSESLHAAKTAAEMLQLFYPTMVCRQYTQLESMDVQLLAETFGDEVKASNGTYRGVLIFPKYVLKFELDKSRQHELVSEFKYIRRMRRSKYRKHFPKTRLIEHKGWTIAIQEKIDGIGGARRRTVIDNVVRLGTKLGIVDIHEDNYGWKKAVPVFIDVDLRTSQINSHHYIS
jgi:hypothetical protein